MALYTSHTDEQLAALLKSGDERAFTELYNRYWEKLAAMAYARLKDLPEAEDVVHDVFASLWKRRQTADIQQINIYLATAIKYTTLKAVKKMSLLSSYRAEQLHLTQPEDMLINAIEQRRISELLTQEIEQLPDKCRLIFLYRKQGLTNSEIAEGMDISAKTVENQLNKGFKQLRVAMKGFLSSFFSLF
jgi:RNA polymerase sigma-70 factor (family 1)